MDNKPIVAIYKEANRYRVEINGEEIERLRTFEIQVSNEARLTGLREWPFYRVEQYLPADKVIERFRDVTKHISKQPAGQSEETLESQYQTSSKPLPRWRDKTRRVRMEWSSERRRHDDAGGNEREPARDARLHIHRQHGREGHRQGIAAPLHHAGGKQGAAGLRAERMAADAAEIRGAAGGRWSEWIRCRPLAWCSSTWRCSLAHGMCSTIEPCGWAPENISNEKGEPSLDPICRMCQTCGAHPEGPISRQKPGTCGGSLTAIAQRRCKFKSCPPHQGLVVLNSFLGNESGVRDGKSNLPVLR